MVPNCESRGEDTEYEEGLGGSLVLDIIRDRIGKEELELEVHLGGDEAQQNKGVGGLSDAEQVSRHRKLREIDSANRDPLGSVNSKSDRKRLKA